MSHPLRFGEPSQVFSTRVPASLANEFKAYIERIIVIRQAGYDVQITAITETVPCQQPT